MPNEVNCFKSMKRHVDIMNTNSVDTINQVGVEIFMGFEGQIGSLPSWMNRTWTKFDERPWMANTLQAHKGNNKQNALNVAAFRYGNKNYRQIAMMNSVTLRQVRDPRTLSFDFMKSTVRILIRQMLGKKRILILHGLKEFLNFIKIHMLVDGQYIINKGE